MINPFLQQESEGDKKVEDLQQKFENIGNVRLFLSW